MSEIAKMLVLSTAHLAEETCNEWLADAPFAVYQKGEYGWFVYVISDYPEDLPEDLKACLDLAHGRDVEWIMFDCDGPFELTLPVYDW